MKTIRLGVLVPSVNYVMEPDMYTMVPPDVSVHFARLRTAAITPDGDDRRETLTRGFEEMAADSVDAAMRLSAVDPQVISYGSTSGSFYRGRDYDAALIRKIQEATGVPAVTPSTATVAALRALGMQKICLIAPYADWITDKAKEFLTAHGFDVPACKGLGLGPLATGQQPPEVARDLALEAYTEECDGVFCSCTFFRAIEVIEVIERKLGKPVVTANQATMWLMLKTAGFAGSVAGFGELMRRL